MLMIIIGKRGYKYSAGLESKASSQEWMWKGEVAGKWRKRAEDGSGPG